MKIIGHLLIWAGSLTIALIPWVERRNIIKKYKFDSDVTYFATCHLLGWGQWSQCPKMGSPNLKQVNKTRQLIGDCMNKEYIDQAPCLCPLDDCPAVKLVENFVKQPCSSTDKKTIEQQKSIQSKDTLFYSPKRLVLGRVIDCWARTSTGKNRNTMTTIAIGNNITALPVPSKSFFTQMQLYFRYATTLYLNFLPRCIYRKESFFA
ncbi:hypothetical protein RB195_000178 [Necator americanus]